MAEALGIVASTGQLLAVASEAVRLALELRQELLKGPRKVQAHIDCLNSTISLLNTVHQQSTSASRSPEVLCFVHAVNEKVQNLHKILQKQLRSISGGPVRKIIAAVSAIKCEEKIKGAFAALEREKANLHLSISIEARGKLNHLLSQKDMDPARKRPSGTDMLERNHQPDGGFAYRVELPAHDHNARRTSHHGHNIQPSHRTMSDITPGRPAENKMLEGSRHAEARLGQELEVVSQYGDPYGRSTYPALPGEQVTSHPSTTMSTVFSSDQVPYPTNQYHSNASNTKPASWPDANGTMPHLLGHKIRSKNKYANGAIVHYGDRYINQEVADYHPLDVDQEDQYGSFGSKVPTVQVGHIFTEAPCEEALNRC